MSSPLLYQQSLPLSANAAASTDMGDGDPALRAKSAANFTTTTTAATTTTTAATTTTTTTTPTSFFATPATATRSSAFRSIITNNDSSSNKQWVTREIAALEFLQVGISMASEKEIVHEGWMRQQLQQQQQQQLLSPRFVDSTKDMNKYIKRGSSDTNQNNVDETRKDDDDDDDDSIPQISPALLPLESNKNSLNSDIGIIRQGRWWEKWIIGQNPTSLQQQQERQKNTGKVDMGVSRDSRIEDLEEPDEQQQQQQEQQQQSQNQTQSTMPTTSGTTIFAPGRRLEGDTAIKIQIPLANILSGGGNGGSHTRHNSDVVSLQLTKQQSIARLAVTREWEIRTAHGLSHHHHHHRQHQSRQNPQEQHHNNKPLMDGRMYMSANESYPIMVFSLLRYEPKKEEAVRLRKKLEERGGGGTQFFIMPLRDWRGISFRSLLPEANQQQRSDRDDHDVIDGNDRDVVDSTPVTPTRKNNNNSNNNRLLFDRFAPKKRMSKGDLTIDTTDDSRHHHDENSNNNHQDEDDDYDDDDDDDDVDINSDDAEGEDTYRAGLLDDPEMVQGRHRNVMIGDRGTGPIVLSTIQFVKPKFLKADLNKQFRERFDGYEPPVSQRKYIGAKVIDGMYTLMDPTQMTGDDDDNDDDTTGANTVGTPTTGTTTSSARSHRKRGSASSISLSTTGDGGGGGGGGSCDGGGEGEGKENIRMPPSLTLSKIRSLKQQALAAAVKAKLEISTVALAIVYFERLALDCRVDKSNRRLSFAACLLLAIKINEPNVGVIITKAIANTSKKSRTSQRIQSLIRPHKKSSTMFASLLEFFTQDWNLSLKHLFAAEWGVFAALQFRLKAKPSDVAFHYKRLMKTLGYDPRRYLGVEMYGSWQQALTEEEFRRQEWESRVENLRQRKEKKKLKQLQRELEAADRRENSVGTSIGDESIGDEHKDKDDREIRGMDSDLLGEDKGIQPPRRRRGLGDILKNRLGGGTAPSKRSLSTDRAWTRTASSKDLLAIAGIATGKPMATTAANDTTMAAVVVPTKQRQRPPLLRPLSKSKSCVALDRVVIGKNIVIDGVAHRNNKPNSEEVKKNIRRRRSNDYDQDDEY